jgi:hypothetical protein
MAETGAYRGELSERRKDHAPLDDAGAVQGVAGIGKIGAAAFGRLVGRVSQQDHVAGGCDGIDQVLIRLRAGQRRRAEFEASPAVGFGKVHVVGDHLRRCPPQVIEKHRVHDARPRPPPGVWFHVAEGVLVDLDEDDVGARRRRPRGSDETPVVSLELDGVQRAHAGAAAHQLEQHLGAENESGRAKANHNSCRGFPHPSIY